MVTHQMPSRYEVSEDLRIRRDPPAEDKERCGDRMRPQDIEQRRNRLRKIDVEGEGDPFPRGVAPIDTTTFARESLQPSVYAWRRIGNGVDPRRRPGALHVAHDPERGQRPKPHGQDRSGKRAQATHHGVSPLLIPAIVLIMRPEEDSARYRGISIW